MRITRLATGAVSAGLLGVSSLALAGTASAAGRDALDTFTVADPSVTVIDYGETIDVSVDVDSQSGSSPGGGTSTLYARPANATEWTAVATNTSPTASFLGVRPGMNTAYKVVYAGLNASDPDDDSYRSSESAPFTVSVARRITHPTAGFVLKGKVTPSYARQAIRVRASKTQGRAYKLVKLIRTDARGRYAYKLPKRKGTWYWHISIKGDIRFRATSFTYETRVF